MREIPQPSRREAAVAPNGTYRESKGYTCMKPFDPKDKRSASV